MFQSPISDDGLSQVAKKCRNLKSLHIEGCLSITETSLRALVQYAKRLQSLTLGRCHQIGEDAILSLLMNQPYLDKLELKGMMAGELHLNGAIQLSALHRNLCLFLQLSSLILVKCSGLQDQGMLKFGRIPFRMLRHLVVDDCKGVTELGLKWLVGDAMNPTKLKTIKLARFHFFTSKAVIEVMSLFSGTIESIILDSCDFAVMMPRFLGVVAWDFPNLKVVKMEHCEKIMELFLSWLDMVCSGLKEVRLIGFPEPAEGYTIGKSLCGILLSNGITKIELRACHFRDLHVCIIAESCQRALQELILDECPNIWGNFVMSVRAYCPNLIKLAFNRTQISDNHIRHLMHRGFRQLEEFSVMGCPMITNIVLAILDAATLPI